MNDYMFFIWVAIAIVQVVLFSFYLGKLSKHDQKIVEEPIDIIPICNYNGNTYWLEDSGLYREKTKNITMKKNNAERVDQLNSIDISPSEIIYIISVLEDNK